MRRVLALTHGYPPEWNLGGEVALHRALAALPAKTTVLTKTDKPYRHEGIDVGIIDYLDVLHSYGDVDRLIEQARALKPAVIIAQNELSLPATRVARALKVPSIIYVHTPPRYGAGVREALPLADLVVYNTQTSAREWGEPSAPVLHPIIAEQPHDAFHGARGDAYTLLSTLAHKGVEVVIELARRLPDQRFIVVQSPAVQMEPPNLMQLLRTVPNVELHPRVAPEEVYEAYLKQTRILLVPSRYETYGMSAIEAAGAGIPSVHVDTPHAREGIGKAAEFVRPLNFADTLQAIERIEKAYSARALAAWERYAEILHRQDEELKVWRNAVLTARELTDDERALRLLQWRVDSPPTATTADQKRIYLQERRRLEAEGRARHRQRILEGRQRLIDAQAEKAASRLPRPHGRA